MILNIGVTAGAIRKRHCSCFSKLSKNTKAMIVLLHLMLLALASIMFQLP